MTRLRFIRELLELAAPDRRSLRFLVALTALGELMLVPGPFLFAWIVGRFTNESSPVTNRELVAFAGVTLLLYALQAYLAYRRVNINRRLTLAAANRLRHRFFGHVLRLPYAHFLTHNAGSQANSYLNDIDDVDLALGNLVETGLRTTLLIFIYGTAVLIWNPLIGVLALVLLPLTVVLQRLLLHRVASSSRRKVDLREALVGDVSEVVQNVAVVKSFGLEEDLARRLGSTSSEFRDADVVLETYQSALRSSAAVLLIFTQYSFFVFGAWMVMTGQLTIGPFLGQILLVGRMTGPLNLLLQYSSQLTQSEAALHRVREVLAKPNEGRLFPRSGHSIPDVDRGVTLEVRDLSFRYREEVPLLENWSFRANPRETIAIVGPSGSGKTTLFQILLGLFEEYQGSIQLNGVELREADLSNWRSPVGVVFQEQILFPGTIRDNLEYGLPEEADAGTGLPEPSLPGSTGSGESTRGGESCGGDSRVGEDRLREVLRAAHAEEFVDTLPNGLDTEVGPGGLNLSGGQKQRLALARVLLKNPPLLLLDEATSALDSISEQHVQQALTQVLARRTSLVIAHRLSTITAADRILVVDEGRIVEQGTHVELVEKGGIYRRLFDAQVSGFLDWDSMGGARD